MIDTHSHIYQDVFNDDIEEVLNRAKAAGVTRIYLPNIDVESISKTDNLAERFDICFPMMGLHPGSVGENYKEDYAKIKAHILSKPNYYKAIGEIGVDLYWDKSFKDAQMFLFKEQIELAIELNLPIVIHCRDAFDEVFEVLEDCKHPKLFGIFHCFTGSHEQALKAISYNLKLGIGGIVTFKNAGLDKVVEQIDLKHLVLETDAPYLAPTPYRGKRNEPSYLKEISQKIADLKEIDVDLLREITSQNAIDIFGK